MLGVSTEIIGLCCAEGYSTTCLGKGKHPPGLFPRRRQGSRLLESCCQLKLPPQWSWQGARCGGPGCRPPRVLWGCASTASARAHRALRLLERSQQEADLPFQQPRPTTSGRPRGSLGVRRSSANGRGKPGRWRGTSAWVRGSQLDPGWELWGRGSGVRVSGPGFESAVLGLGFGSRVSCAVSSGLGARAPGHFPVWGPGSSLGPGLRGWGLGLERGVRAQGRGSGFRIQP